MNKFAYFKTMASARLLWRKYRGETMIPPVVYAENLALAAAWCGDLDGAVIECGTWKGGMSAGLVETLGKQRDYWFFDSFEGLPPVTEEDGASALAYQETANEPGHYDNCAADIGEFRKTIARTGVPAEKFNVVKGFFEDSFAKIDAASIPPLAVLRLDADWYESTKVCLEKFWDKLKVGGILLIDDYHVWPGCTLAVNEFLARTEPPQRMQQGPFGRVAFIVKSAAS